MAISKNVMLAKMEITEKDGHRVEHQITFVKQDGSLREMRCMNHVKNPQGNHEKAEGTKFKFNLKEKGALLLHDIDLDRPRTVLVERILFFNGEPVLH